MNTLHQLGIIGDDAIYACPIELCLFAIILLTNNVIGMFHDIKSQSLLN